MPYEKPLLKMSITIFRTDGVGGGGSGEFYWLVNILLKSRVPGVDILQSISTTWGLRACTVEVLFIFHLKMVKLSNSFEAIKKGRRERCYLYWGSNTCIVIPFTGWPKSEKHSGITADAFQYNVLHNAFIVRSLLFFSTFQDTQ